MNFLSVSGVTNAEELDAVAGIYCELQSPTDLLIGYQVSHKSIKERVKNSRQPYVTELPALTKKTCENGLFPAIHYFTRDNNTILDDLEWLVTEGVPPGLLQFNTLPPSVEILSEVKKRGFQTIFKVAVASPAGYAVWKDGNAVDVTSGNIEPLVDQVLQRKDVISYAMFDPIHGTNLGLELGADSMAIRFGQAMQNLTVPTIFAGGIGPDNVSGVVRLLNYYFDDFGIDTESGVRTNDELDLEKVKQYLIGFQEAVR